MEHICYLFLDYWQNINIHAINFLIIECLYLFLNITTKKNFAWMGLPKYVSTKMVVSSGREPTGPVKEISQSPHTAN